MSKKKRVKKKILKKKSPSKVRAKKIVKKKDTKTVVKKVEPEVKRLGWSFYILPPILLVVSFLSFLIFLFAKNYQSWEETFPSSDIFILEIPNDQISLDGKIREYNEEGKEYSFIEFTKEESLFLLSDATGNSLPDWVELEKTGLYTSKGLWKFYLKTKAFSFEMPWLEIILKKEDVQSVEIFVEDVSIGDLSLKNIGFSSVVSKIDDGFGRAIRLVNDGNFAGRVFENIELGDENLVIKSRNFSF
jgi:hypothetical protein